MTVGSPGDAPAHEMAWLLVRSGEEMAPDRPRVV